MRKTWPFATETPGVPEGLADSWKRHASRGGLAAQSRLMRQSLAMPLAAGPRKAGQSMPWVEGAMACTAAMASRPVAPSAAVMMAVSSPDLTRAAIFMAWQPLAASAVTGVEAVPEVT